MPPAFVPIQSGRLTIEVQELPDGLLVRPKGVLNEDFDFGRMLDFLRQLPMAPTKVIFDMGFVTQINSCGTREWLLFIQRLQAAFKIEFQRMGEVFMEAAGIVDNMAGPPGTPIQQVEVPFSCPKCSHRDTQYFGVAEIFPGGATFAAPIRSCAKCKTTMEIDAIEEEYFAFLRNRL